MLSSQIFPKFYDLCERPSLLICFPSITITILHGIIEIRFDNPLLNG